MCETHTPTRVETEADIHIEGHMYTEEKHTRTEGHINRRTLTWSRYT